MFSFGEKLIFQACKTPLQKFQSTQNYESVIALVTELYLKFCLHLLSLKRDANAVLFYVSLF